MVFLLVVRKDGVVDVVDHCDKFKDISDMAIKYLGNATLIKEDHEAQNAECFYKKINDQHYVLYEAIEQGYIFENWVLKERAILNIVHYNNAEIVETYASKVKKTSK